MSVAVDSFDMADTIPLLSQQLLRSAQLPPAETAMVSSRYGERTEEVLARVQAQFPVSDKHHQLTLEIDGKQLMVTSKYPLPLESQLRLRLLIQLPRSEQTTQEKVIAIRVLEIMQASQPTVSKQPPSAVLSQWLAQRLPHSIQDRQGPGPQAVYRPLPSQQTTTRTQTSAPASPELPARDTQVSPIKTARTNSQMNSVINAIRPLLSPDMKVPEPALRPLQAFIQQLPASAQQAALKLPLLIQHSGVSFEHNLLSVLSAAASSNNKSRRDPSPASQHFQQLWQQLRTLAADTKKMASNTASTPKPGLPLSLATTRGHLESALTSHTAIPGDSSVTQLPSSYKSTGLHDSHWQALFERDHKAVLGKSLLIWQQLLKPATTSTRQTMSQLLATSQEERPEGFRLLQSALATLELEQFQRLQQPQEQWQLSLPLLFRHQQQLQEVGMTLFKDKEESNASSPDSQKVRWRVHLHFDLPKLGPLDVAVDMSLPTLSATFWSTNPRTLERIQPQLMQLQANLSRLGVTVESLTSRYGELPPAQQNRIQGSLVDVHS